VLVVDTLWWVAGKLGDRKSIVDQIKTTRSHVQEVPDANLIGGKVSRAGPGKTRHGRKGDPVRYKRVARSKQCPAATESTILAPSGTKFLSASTTSLYQAERIRGHTSATLLSASTTSLYEAERIGGQTSAPMLSASTTSLYQAERIGGQTSAPNETLRMTG
jgi:hypothetical protein